MAEPRNRTLTIYAIPDTSLEDSQLLQSADQLYRRTISLHGTKIGDLYLRPAKPKRPAWLDLFAGALNIGALDLSGGSPSGVLLLRRTGATLAVTFGYGRFLLQPPVWEENFALKACLNAIDPGMIRSLDRQAFDSISRHTREQASREVPVADFGLDVEQDLLRAVTGKPKDPSLGSRLSGMDALSASIRIKLADLPALLDRYLERSRDTTYRQTFPWVDHVGEVRNRGIVERLDEELLKKIETKQLNRLWLAVPDIVDWSDVAGFRYGASPNTSLFPDLHLRDFVASLPDPDAVQATDLRHRHAYMFSTENDQVRARWPIYRCLYCELEYKGDTYLLSNGKWYQIAKDFVASVNNDVSSIPGGNLPFPPYEDSSEGHYNARVATESNSKLVLLDEKLVQYGGGSSKIEFCDLLSSQRQIIHVKRYGGSSVLSHLFAQGTISATLFMNDAPFRQELNGLLPTPYRLSDTSQRPSAGQYTVVFAIINRAQSTLDLPFFSRLNLRNAARTLRGLGYEVALQKIPLSASTSPA